MPTSVVKIFRPFSIGDANTWQLFRGTSKIVAVDPLEPLSHDENATAIQIAGAATRQTFGIDRNFPDSMGLITEMRVFVRYAAQITTASKIKVSIGLGGGPTFVDSADLSSGLFNYNDVSAVLARPGGGPWVEDDLRDLTFQIGVLLGTGLLWMRVTSLWLATTFDPTDESRGAIPPEFPSRKLRRSRLPVGVLNSTFRGDALDIDLLTDFEVSHSEGIKDGGKGWGEEDWERRSFRCFDNDLNPNDMTVRLKALDLYDYFCMFWWTGIAPYTVKSDETFPDGHAELHPGVTETFIRSGTAHVLDGSNIVQQLASGFKRFSPDGLLLEAGVFNFPVVNRIINSSFFNGTTSWTLGGAGDDALDTDEKLFSDEAQQALGGTNRSLKLTYNGDEKFAYQDISGFIGLSDPDTIAYTIWRKDSNTSRPGYYAIQNNTSGNWYDASAQTWGAQFVRNVMPAVTDKFTRFVVVFKPEYGDDSYRFFIRSTNTSAADTWFAHVQVEFNSTGGLAAGSSPIPTFNSTGIRQHEYLSFSNPVGRRIWPTLRGTVIIRVKFFFDGPLTTWSAVPVPHETSGLGLLCAYHGNFNWFYLNYNYGETLDFSISNPGGTDVAQIDFTPVNEQTYVFAARWTSLSGGELDLPAGTISVFKDGVKGTDAFRTDDVINDADTPVVAIGNPTVPTGELFGSISRIQEPLAAFSHFEVLPWCLTDEEIAARSQL